MAAAGGLVDDGGAEQGGDVVDLITSAVVGAGGVQGDVLAVQGDGDGRVPVQEVGQGAQSPMKLARAVGSVL